MARYTYERLSAQDASFLFMERQRVHMHVAATAIYDARPLQTEEGGIDIDKFRAGIEAALHLIPRYRQKLKWVPYHNHPVWVDDRHFDLQYHVRHTALPRPGSEDQLKQLSARIMSHQLDRSKPLWEFWVVEGLSENRFAIISKVHHCMIDGMSGADLATILMSASPDYETPAVYQYMPRPAPSSLELFQHETKRMVSAPVQIFRSVRDFRRQTENVRAEIGKRANAIGDLLGYAITSPSETPLNGHISSHRMFDFMSTPIADVKSVRRAFGCTLNDLVLATVSGAVRSYLIRRRVDPKKIDFRVSAPVSVRPKDHQQGELGNNVSSWILRLPIGERDPIKRLEAIHRVTSELKRSEQALGVQMLMAAAEWAPSALLSLGSQATSGPINMIVTNVPGPQVPLYMMGSRLMGMFPQVPLLENTGLGIALFSYDGSLNWGFNCDPSLVPDVGTFVSMVRSSFEELKHAASLRPAVGTRSDADTTKEAAPSSGTAESTGVAKGSAWKPHVPRSPTRSRAGSCGGLA
jgi:diacylglycerol O-acyltransferase